MAKLLNVGRPLTGLCGEQIIEQKHRVLTGERGGGLIGGDAPIQLQAVIHGQLAGGVGAGEVAGAVAQQREDHRGRLSQTDLPVGAEGAVAERGDHAPAHRRLHIAGGPVASGYVRVGGGRRLSHSVSVGRGFDGHGDKLGPGHLPGQLQVAAAVPV